MFTNTITVETLASLLINNTQVDIYFNDTGKTYRFDNDEIPEEILYATVTSIDDPFNANGACPLCMNIDECDILDDVEAFAEEYKDYEV